MYLITSVVENVAVLKVTGINAAKIFLQLRCIKYLFLQFFALFATYKGEDILAFFSHYSLLSKFLLKSAISSTLNFRNFMILVPGTFKCVLSRNI